MGPWICSDMHWCLINLWPSFSRNLEPIGSSDWDLYRGRSVQLNQFNQCDSSNLLVIMQSAACSPISLVLIRFSWWFCVIFADACSLIKISVPGYVAASDLHHEAWVASYIIQRRHVMIQTIPQIIGTIPSERSGNSTGLNFHLTDVKSQHKQHKLSRSFHHYGLLTRVYWWEDLFCVISGWQLCLGFQDLWRRRGATDPSWWRSDILIILNIMFMLLYAYLRYCWIMDVRLTVKLMWSCMSSW